MQLRAADVVEAVGEVLVVVDDAVVPVARGACVAGASCGTWAVPAPRHARPAPTRLLRRRSDPIRSQPRGEIAGSRAPAASIDRPTAPDRSIYPLSVPDLCCRRSLIYWRAVADASRPGSTRLEPPGRRRRNSRRKGGARAPIPRPLRAAACVFIFIFFLFSINN